jgi:hypothetical protein
VAADPGIVIPEQKFSGLSRSESQQSAYSNACAVYRVGRVAIGRFVPQMDAARPAGAMAD